MGGGVPEGGDSAQKWGEGTVPAGRASGDRAGGPGVSSAGETEKREKHRGGPGGGRRGKSSAHSKLPPGVTGEKRGRREVGRR